MVSSLGASPDRAPRDPPHAREAKRSDLRLAGGCPNEGERGWKSRVWYMIEIEGRPNVGKLYRDELQPLTHKSSTVRVRLMVFVSELCPVLYTQLPSEWLTTATRRAYPLFHLQRCDPKSRRCLPLQVQCDQ